MNTARLLTVSPSMHCAGGGLLASGGSALPGGSPCKGGLPGQVGVVSQHALRQTVPHVNRIC